MKRMGKKLILRILMIFYNKSEISLYENIEIYLKLSDDQKINYIKKLKYFINVNNNLENTLNITFNLGL